MKFNTLLIIAFTILIGCASSSFKLSHMDREQLSTLTDAQLLQAMGSDIRRNNLIFKEISSRGLTGSISNKQLIEIIASRRCGMHLTLKEARSRNLFTEEEIELIRKRAIIIGMSEHALIASWGFPIDINRSVGNYGTHKQYVYGSYSNNFKHRYVYIENGKVTGFQD